MGVSFARLFALGAAIACAQSPSPTIRVPVRLVRAPTLVFSRDGELISGLARSAFHVRDNGREQNVQMDTELNPVSVAVAMQCNLDVRSYVPFLTHVGTLIEALLAGEGGECALLRYDDDVTIVKGFDEGDVGAALRSVSARGQQVRMIDAGAQSVALLQKRPASRVKVLLFIGQPMDRGSETTLESLREQVERANVTVFALTLPLVGKAWVSDTFSLKGLPSSKGGFQAGADLIRLGRAARASGASQQGTDPFSVLAAVTGGTQAPFRRQRELESRIAAVGTQLRSSYVLSYAPSSTESGYHKIQVDVDVPGARAYARQGYWMAATETEAVP